MIEQLPYDVLLDCLFPYLKGTDLVSLQLTSRQLNAIVDNRVWRAAYLQEFGPGATGTDWAVNYAQRYNSVIYTWGHNKDGRLGYSLRQGSPSENRRGSNRPHLLNFGRVKQIEAGGFGFFMLRMDGSVWYTGSLHEHLGFSSQAKQYEGTYDHISAGRDTLLGLLNGKIYNVETKELLLPVPLESPKYTQIAAGWHLNAAVDEQGTLSLWSQPDIMHTISPLEILQIEAGSDYVLWLDSQQRLFWVHMHEQYVRIYEELRPIRIKASYNRFAIICEDEVHLGHYENRQRTLETVSGSFVDVALGDHHTLVLNSQGECFAWGRESQRCGSFGLGSQAEVERLGGSAERTGFNLFDLVLGSPQKLDLKNVLQVAAGGWHSAAVCAST